MTKRRARYQFTMWQFLALAGAFLVAYVALSVAWGPLPSIVEGLLGFGFMMIAAQLIYKEDRDRRRSESSALDDDADGRDR